MGWLIKILPPLLHHIHHVFIATYMEAQINKNLQAGSEDLLNPKFSIEHTINIIIKLLFAQFSLNPSIGVSYFQTDHPHSFCIKQDPNNRFLANYGSTNVGLNIESSRCGTWLLATVVFMFTVTVYYPAQLLSTI